ncbi:MAG: T9SS type A sorting domain-containing protein [Ignavibacteriaceae bacterium]
MKPFLILILFCFSAVIIAQNPNWTSVKETNINVGSALSFDIFTNQDGNHIIVQTSDSLKYYKMNLNGQAGSPITLESVSVVSPSITGDGTRLYVVYRRSSETTIRAKYSTNGGSSWLNLSNTLTNQSASSIESVMSNNNIHITFQVGSSVYYSRKYALDGTAWTTPFTVSNTETASVPRIAAWTNGSADEVFFVFKTSSTAGKWRMYNVVANQWSDIFNGYSVSPQDLMTSGPAGLTAGSNYVRYHYYRWTFNTPYFSYREFNKNGSLITDYFPDVNYTTKVFNTVTQNGTGHTAYWYNWQWIEGGSEDFEQGIWRSKNSGTTYYPKDLVYWNVYQEPVYDPPVNLSSAGNEVHVIWKDNLGLNNGNHLRYKYDDLAPLAPQNYAVSVYQSGNNKYPKLSWTLNNEPDVKANTQNAYKLERRTRNSRFEAWSAWSNIANLGGTVSTYIDYTINTAGGGDKEAEYRITAIDIENNQSPQQSVIIIYGMGGLDKISSIGNVIEYELNQNYPNPFNPSTKISYSIKEDGFVTLKVYDILGVEIATLVNEPKTAGSYEADFNAAYLPSGIYIYKLQSGSFTDVKKMLLTK